MATDTQTIPHVGILAVRLFNYKNYQSIEVDFCPKVNFFVGVNGAGKTNLLDALHYLCITRGFVTPQDKYNTRFDADFFRLEARVIRGSNQHGISVKVRSGSLKEVAVDDVKVERLADHIGFLPVIVLTPGDQELIYGPSAGRRRFVDFYLSQIDRDYLDDMLFYNRLLAQRNALLKEHGFHADKQLLVAYTEKMLPHAQRISKRRQTFIEMIQPMVTNVYGTVSEHADDVTIAYTPDATATSFVDLSLQSLDKDRALGRTSRGVHRDDIAFVMNERAIKRYGSQGQMKTYLVALHLAMRRYVAHQSGVTPIVLMDDIFGKLDDNRVKALVSLLSGGDGGQVFITDARRDRILDICQHLDARARVIEIADARVISVIDYGNSGQKKNLAASEGYDQEE